MTPARSTFKVLLCRTAFYLLLCSVFLLPAFSHASGLQEPRVLKTIIIDNYAPYTYVNKEGQPAGFTVDLMQAVAQVMGFEIEIKVDTWDHALHALESGDIDFLPMMAYSKERDKTFDFSPPHTIAYDAFFTRQDSGVVNSLADLAGRTIIVMENDQAHQYLKSVSFIQQDQLILVNSLPQALQLLASGKGDTALMPKLVGLLLIRDLNLTDLAPSPVVVEAYNRPFSFAVKNGNQAVLERLNQGMIIIKTEGKYDEIYKNWFGALEPGGLYNDVFLKYLGYVILGLVLIGALLLIWTFLLRKQVAVRTRSLTMEMQERKQAEEALRESNDYLENLFNYANAPIIVWDTHFKITRFNHAFKEITGRSESEVLGKPLEILFPPDQTDLSMGLIHKTLTGERWEVVEIAIQHVDGSIRTLLWNSATLFSADGKTPVATIAQGQDITARKQAEEARRESEDKFKYVFEYSVVGKSITQIKGGIQVNKAFCDMLGYSYQEMQEKTWQEITHPDDIELTKNQMDMLISGRQESVRFVKRFIHKNGNIVWVDLSSALRRDETHTPLYFMSSLVNITERKQAEQALHESRAILQAAMDQSSEGIAIADAPDGTLRYVNDAGLLIRGGDRQTIVDGIGIAQYVASWQLLDLDGTPLKPEEVPLARSVLFGEICKREFIIRRADNDDRIVLGNAAPIKDDAGRVVAGIVVFTDITDRKRSEVEMENMARFPAENPSPVLRVNRDGNLLYINEAGLALLHDWHLVVGEPVPQVLHQAVTESMAGHLKEWIDTVQGGRILSFSVSPIREAGYANFYGRDVTRSRQAEAERERLLDELERKNQELESIVYVASHDLRSPLVNIQGFGVNLQKYFRLISESLKNARSLDELRVAAEPILTERIPKALQFVEVSSMKMDVLISGLLRLSRIGRIWLQLEVVDMDLLVQNILDGMAFQIEKASAEFRVQLPLTPCYGDKDQLSQVFSNLLDNAIKYRAFGRPLAITISSEINDRKVVYSITDTGQGIAPEHQEKIWEIFHRFEEDATIPGEGLGLTIARRIIERHRGRIWVESKPEVGSCFRVELPLGA